MLRSAGGIVPFRGRGATWIARPMLLQTGHPAQEQHQSDLDFERIVRRADQSAAENLERPFRWASERALARGDTTGISMRKVNGPSQSSRSLQSIELPQEFTDAVPTAERLAHHTGPNAVVFS